MRFHHVAIESLAYALPEERLTSDAIEAQLAPLYERLKLPEGRLELMTGIKERRLWEPDTQPSDASALAAKTVLDKSRFPAQSIELLAHCAVSRDRLEPATASYVHRLAELPNSCQILDISNACLGFLNAMTLAAGMIESGQMKRILICAGENGRPLVEGTIQHLLNTPELTRNSIKPFFANLTVGCGAVAAILCHTDELEGAQAPRLLGGTVRTDTQANELCQGGNASAGGLEMQTDSEELLAAGIALAKANWQAFRDHTGWNNETPERVICHQVGRRHQTLLLESLGLNVEKDYITYPFLGNVGSVSLPITLAHALDAEAIAPGAPVALLGIGSGLSSMMLAIEA